jgi:hypothetical protein
LGAFEEESEEETAAIDRADGLEEALCQTRPSTVAGILAIMRYRREIDAASPGYSLFPDSSYGPVTQMSRWLGTIEQSIAAIAGEVVS